MYFTCSNLWTEYLVLGHGIVCKLWNGQSEVITLKWGADLARYSCRKVTAEMWYAMVFVAIVMETPDVENESTEEDGREAVKLRFNGSSRSRQEDDVLTQLKIV